MMRRFLVFLWAFWVVAALAQPAGSGAAGAEQQWWALNAQVVAAYREGRYPAGLEAAQRALKFAETEFGADHPSTGASLNNLAELYRAMGAYDKALPLYQRALLIAEKAEGPEHPSTGTRLNNLAGLYESMGAYDKALPLYQRALLIAEKAQGPEHPETGTRLNNLALLYQDMGAYDKALPLYQRALLIAEKALGPEHPSTGTSLNNLAELYRAMGAYDKALPLLQQAFQIGLIRAEGGNDPEFLAQVAANLCFFINEQKLASENELIFYCKLGVNMRQLQRQGAKGLDKGLRESFANKVSKEYSLLARLLLQAGRYREAEIALMALKNAEFTEFLRGKPTGGAEPIPLTPDEKQLQTEFFSVAKELGDIYTKINRQTLGVETINATELARQSQQRLSLQTQMAALIKAVSQRLDKPVPEQNQAFKIEDSRLIGLTRALATSSQGDSNVLISYIVEERVTTVFLITPTGPLAWQLEVGSQTLNPLMSQLQEAMLRTGDYKPAAQALHRHLIRPVQEKLTALGQPASTWMLYLTGRLRYLPFAALMDEQGRHLVETQKLAIYTAAAADQAKEAALPNWRVAAFGSTREHPRDGLGPLPAVAQEVAAIVRDKRNPQGILPGQQWLNAEFNRDNWQQVLNPLSGSRPGVLHVATHFLAKPDWAQSYLLLGDGTEFRLPELYNDASLSLHDVDLFTLSACGTEMSNAKADGAEFEGLGTLLQRKGARSVIGTLWAVQDEGSAKLMEAFYRARGEQRQMSKAAALQAAQLQLLRGEVRSPTPGVNLSHPSYWAPFVLMGNWL